MKNPFNPAFNLYQFLRDTSGSPCPFHQLCLPAVSSEQVDTAGNYITRALSVNQKGKIVVEQLSNELKLTLKPYEAEGIFRWQFPGCVSLRASPFSLSLSGRFKLL